MTVPSTHSCAAEVHDGFGVSFHGCSKRGRYHEDGKWWCGTHRPSVEAARQAKRNAAYQERRAESDRLEAQAEQLSQRAAALVYVHYDHNLRPTQSVIVRADELDRLLREAGR